MSKNQFFNLNMLQEVEARDFSTTVSRAEKQRWADAKRIVHEGAQEPARKE